MPGSRVPKCRTPFLRAETFDVADTSGWMEHLEREGYVVLSDVLTKEQAMYAEETFKREWCEVSPEFDWDDPTTWEKKTWPVIDGGKGSVMMNGFAHSETNWFLRLESRAKEAFAHIYKTEELAASFDGFSVFLDPSQDSQSWLHTDQRSQDTRISVQGILNVHACDELDAGFVCVPGTHKTYTAPPQDNDWGRLPKDNPYKKLATKILTPERSLIIFSSKLIHANRGMVKKHPNGRHFNRFSAYTTFVPKERQSAEIVELRKDGYRRGIACSHWADRFEPKRISPYVIGEYSRRALNTLKPMLTEEGEIPPHILTYI